jgi:hypothetical protein
MDGTTIRRNYKEAREIAAEFLCEKYNLKVSQRNDYELHIETSKGVFRLCLYIPDPREVFFDLYDSNNQDDAQINGRSKKIVGGNCFREKYPKLDLHKEGLAMYKTYVKENQSLVGVEDDKVSENTVDNLCFFFKVQIMLMINWAPNKIL